MHIKSYNVIMKRNGKWEVREYDASGRVVSSKPSKSYVSKKDAVRSAVDSAKRSRSAIFVHKRDGRIEASATYSTGEPYLPSSLRYK